MTYRVVFSGRPNKTPVRLAPLRVLSVRGRSAGRKEHGETSTSHRVLFLPRHPAPAGDVPQVRGRGLVQGRHGVERAKGEEVPGEVQGASGAVP